MRGSLKLLSKYLINTFITKKDKIIKLFRGMADFFIITNEWIYSEKYCGT